MLIFFMGGASGFMYGSGEPNFNKKNYNAETASTLVLHLETLITKHKSSPLDQELPRFFTEQSFFNKCSEICGDTQITEKTKKMLAEDYCQAKIVTKNYTHKVPRFFTPFLSPLDNFRLELHETNPEQWSTLEPFQKAQFSLKAIERLGKTKIDQSILYQNADLKNDLVKSAKQHLTHVQNFLTFYLEQKESLNQNIFTITELLQKNKYSLNNLIRLTTDSDSQLNPIKTLMELCDGITRIAPELPNRIPEQTHSYIPIRFLLCTGFCLCVIVALLNYRDALRTYFH
jgi:hypothetical protein